MERTPLIGIINDWGTVQYALQGAAISEAVEVDNKGALERAIKHCDGLILTGGGDIEPSRYGAERHAETYGLDHARDVMEFRAVRLAQKHRIPIMGICRGHQLLNVAFGGTLEQHLPDLKHRHGHGSHKHDVLLGESALARALNNKHAIGQATSLHHQAVDQMGDGLIPIGWAPDGTIEALESVPGAEQYVLGVQFHPEMMSTKAADAIFEHFVKVCAKRMPKRKLDAYKRACKVDPKVSIPKKPVVVDWGEHKGSEDTAIVRVKDPYSHWWDEDYQEWQRTEEVAELMAEKPGLSPMHCVDPPCLGDGCSKGECLKEELDFEFRLEIEAKKRGNGRG